MHIINTLAPVFVIIALGAVLRKSRFLSAQLIEGLNQLVYWVGLPCLLFYKIATADYDFQTAGKTFIVVLGSTAVCIVIAYIMAAVLKLPAVSTGTFVQGSFRGNLLYIGLSIVIYGFAGAENATRMQNIAVIVLALMVPVYNMAAVVVLLASQHRIDRNLPAKLFWPLITNPFFIACLCGICYSVFFDTLPLVVNRTLNAVGQIALPLALLAIGGTLAQGSLSGNRSFAFAASIIKVAFAPVIGFFIAALIGLGAGETRVALIYLACPTAVISYVMAEQLAGDSKLAAAIVLLSTIVSVISLALVVALF